MILYRDYIIETAPTWTRKVYQFTHTDFDGPEDHRHGNGDTIEDCKKQIDEKEDR